MSDFLFAKTFAIDRGRSQNLNNIKSHLNICFVPMFCSREQCKPFLSIQNKSCWLCSKKTNLTFLTYCRPCAFLWLMTKKKSLFADHCTLNLNKQINTEQESVKDEYIPAKEGYLPDLVYTSPAHPGPTGFLLFTLSMKYLMSFDFHPLFRLRFIMWKDWLGIGHSKCGTTTLPLPSLLPKQSCPFGLQYGARKEKAWRQTDDSQLTFMSSPPMPQLRRSKEDR